MELSEGTGLSKSIFDTTHNLAFEQLGARAPGQHWSSFDVSVPEAERGKASLLVTTIWNKHRLGVDGSITDKTKRAILKDRLGRYWYEVAQPHLADKRLTWRAHWKKMQIAFSRSTPIIGILKDYQTGRCASGHLFDCAGRRF